MAGQLYKAKRLILLFRLKLKDQRAGHSLWQEHPSAVVHGGGGLCRCDICAPLQDSAFQVDNWYPIPIVIVILLLNPFHFLYAPAKTWKPEYHMEISNVAVTHTEHTGWWDTVRCTSVRAYW